MKKERRFKLWTILPYNIGRIRDKYLVVTPFGSWSVLTKKEFRKFHSFNIDENSFLFKKLLKDRVIISEETFPLLIKEFRSLHRNWFLDASLHIAVVTNSCNFNCIYCQAKGVKGEKEKMNFEVAAKVLEFMFSVRNQNVRLEIQGGEPLLNWPVVKFLVKEARKINKVRKKNLIISLVSNLSLLDRKKAEFLIENNVEISTSLDGPEFLHNKQRVFEDGSGSYRKISQVLKLWYSLSKKKKVKPRIGALPTITKFSLPHWKEIVDEYVKWKFSFIHLRPVSPLGKAKENWQKIGITPKEFIDFWKKGLDYILELNQKGIKIREMTTFVMLTKILKKQDPYYADLESPCGAGRCQLAYAFNGDIYTCDEGRMIKDDIFKLGNVFKTNYQNLGKNPSFYSTLQSSLLDFWDYNSPFFSWSGTCPVLNWEEQRNPVVKITQTSRKKILDAQFNYIFEKIIFDKKALKIFESWFE